MPQTVNRLKAIDIPRLTQPGMYPDGGGLYLQVKSAAARSWLYRYTIKGKARWRGLGSAQDLSLAEARQRRDKERQSVKSGIDPVAVIRASTAADRAAKEAAAVKVKTFAEWVDSYIADQQSEWRNAKHGQQWRNTLDRYAIPIIGPLGPGAVTASHVADILRPIWIEKNETARRVRGRIETVLYYAAGPDDLTYANPAKLTPQLKGTLPKLGKSRRSKHHPALPYSQIGQFMGELRAREGTAARALEFAILTATRTSEALLARWNEIDDVAAAVWKIPGERMKADTEHRVPLSPAALAVIADMRKVRESDFIFPGLKAGRPLSNMAMLAVLDRMGHGDVTVHGFRSTFRDWVSDVAREPRELAEAALAHAPEDETEAAYARSDLLERRRPLMAKWAQYCGEDLGAGNVVPMRNSELPR
jgi:integrase